MKDLKAPLRRQMRALLKTEAPTLPARSAVICEHIRMSPFWGTARTVGLFYPLPQEPDLRALIQEQGRRLVFPRIVGEALVWHEVLELSSLQPNTTSGLERLLEPVNGAPVPLGEIDLLLVPGLAFTRAGARLGRGGGYYDRVLAKLGPGTKSVGVCFEFQVLDTLPLEAHDIPVQQVCRG